MIILIKPNFIFGCFKKSINNAKKDIKKSTNKKALKGGRRSKTNKKKSRARRRRTRKNKTH